MKTELVNVLLEKFYNTFYEIEEYSLKQGMKLLTTTELHIIEAIGENTLSMNELSDKLKITMGTATVAVTKLCEKEFISRERSTDDRRKVFVKLSLTGVEALNYHTSFHKNIISNITDNLNEHEIDSFLSVFSKIVNSLEEQMVFVKPVPLSEISEGVSVRVSKIKGTPALQSFFKEKNIIENSILRIKTVDFDSSIITIETSTSFLELSFTDAKNILVIKTPAN